MGGGRSIAGGASLTTCVGRALMYEELCVDVCVSTNDGT